MHPTPIPGTSADVLLATVAQRLYSAALGVGKTADHVPALKGLKPLAEKALKCTKKEKDSLNGTLSTLSYLFQLDQFGSELLLMSLGLEMDEHLYTAALNLTGTLLGSPGPRVGSWLSLLYPDLGQRTEALGALMEESPLIRYRLIHLLGNSEAPVSQREICGEPSLVQHLAGGTPPRLSGSLIGLADLVLPEPDAAMGNKIPEELSRMIDLLLLKEVPINALHIHPIRARDVVPVARRIATNQGRPVIVLDLRTVEGDMNDSVALALRESRLRHGFPMFVNPMSTGDDEPNARTISRVAHRWRRVLTSEPDLVIFATDDHDDGDVARLEQVGLSMAQYTIPKTTLHRRTELFSRVLERVADGNGGGVSHVLVSDDVSPEQLAAVYRVDEGDIQAIVEHAVVLAQLRALEDDEPTAVTSDDLWTAGREQTRRDVSKFAHLVESNYSWDDLVLPKNVKGQLEDFFKAARSRAHVFEDWGYGKKHLRGLGLCAMFSGKSGTGKTMAAEVVANMLNVNMYRVDLSAVVSKWVGETERNLAEIFQATECSDSILFFDEADSLFGKRTEVSDSKDRYANIEVSYLLQRIETYDGIVILSTNLRANIDDAFLRRLQFGIHFDLPDEACRRRIWENVLLEDVPLAKDVDLEAVARRYRSLSGGQIRMIAIGASMLAAGGDSKVTQAHIHRAYVHEMDKGQRLVEETHDLDDREDDVLGTAGPGSFVR